MLAVVFPAEVREERKDLRHGQRDTTPSDRRHNVQGCTVGEGAHDGSDGEEDEYDDRHQIVEDDDRPPAAT